MKQTPKGFNLIELMIALTLAGVVLFAATQAVTTFMKQSARQRNEAKAAELLELVAADIRSNFAKRKSEAVPVPNPQVNLVASANSEMGTAAAPTPPCVSAAAGPVCVKLEIKRNGNPADVTYQTKCNGLPIPPGNTVSEIHPSIANNSCPASPQIEINRDGKITNYPGKLGSDVTAMAICFRCYDKGSNTYEWIAELSAAYQNALNRWTVIHKNVPVSTDLLSSGIEIVGP